MRCYSCCRYEAEAAAGRILFRGTFATQRPGGSSTNVGDLYVKNTSNTNVCCFGDRLWTLFEAGQPYRLDPFTLETMGIDLLNGALRPGLPFNLGSKQSNSRFAGFARRAQGAGAAALPAELLQAGGDAVTAHPSVDPVTGRLVFFSYRVRPVVPSALGKPPVETELTFWEVEEGSSGDMRAVQRQRLTISGFAFLHDFALTENYYVIFQNPVTVDNGPYLLGHLPAAACVRWVPGAPTLVHLVPRAAAGEDGNTKNFNVQNMEAAEVDVTAQVRTFVAPPLFVFHHANAFEQDTPGGRCVVMDSIHYDSLPAVGREALASQHVDPDAAFTSRLRRVEINLDTGVMVRVKLT